MRSSAAFVLALTAGLLVSPAAPAAEADPDLARQGYAVLKKYCYRCHGVNFEVPRFNVLDRDILVGKRDGKKPYVTPGKLEESYLWRRVGVKKDMPPEDPEPTDAERLLLKKWIEGGAPFPGAEAARPYQGEKDILAAIRTHLRTRVDPEDRRFKRYFTLTHLANNPTVKDEDLRLYRAALAKVVNSLSWEADVVVPRAVDKAETVFVVDLRTLGWDRHDLWREILKAYPYGLSYEESPDRPKQDLAKEVYDLTGSSLPYLRADWFIATASRPPLYHRMLELPANARLLEKRLGVDIPGNFLKDKLARAGLTTSGVSKQNRLVERHPARGGSTYYWKSYDFKSNEGRGNLVRFPLGPDFARTASRPGNPLAEQAFEHAGGEIIFNLPNGLQGYLLVDNKDNRIDEGPIEIVRDKLETAGSPVIVNGLSCMACHKHGMIGGFKDVVRGGKAVFGRARQKVERLYVPAAEMDRLLKKDETRFLAALEEATGPFLKVGDDQKRDLRDFAEPVGAIATLYVKDLGLEEVARELDFKDPKELLTLVKGNARLRELGLGPLAEGAAIKRQLWESLKGTYCLFQKVALELELGTPYRLRK